MDISEIQLQRGGETLTIKTEVVVVVNASDFLSPKAKDIFAEYITFGDAAYTLSSPARLFGIAEAGIDFEDLEDAEQIREDLYKLSSLDTEVQMRGYAGLYVDMES